MKKILFSMMATCVCFFTVVAQTRITIHEEFTGENCPPCASTNPSFWTLCDLASNQAKLIHITYMSPIPSAGPFYNTVIPKTALDARRTYYSVPFAPYGRYDGAIPDPSCGSPAGSSAGHPACFTQSDIDNEAAIVSSFNITATHYFNTAKDSVFGKVIIKALSATGGSQLKLRAAFAKSMNFTSPPGTNGETDYKNVVRTMFPDATGISMSSSWTVGTPITYTYKGKIQGLEALTNYTTVDSMFVVWIQNDSNKAVMQAARSTYAPVKIENVLQSMSEINVYPNPATNIINITGMLNTPSETKVVILNTLGQVVSENIFSANSTMFSENISLNNISNGIYFINIINNGEKITKKFTINK